MDRNRLIERIAELKQQHTQGEEQLRHLEQRKNDLQQTLLRISGAITVLEEVLQELPEAEG